MSAYNQHCLPAEIKQTSHNFLLTNPIHKSKMQNTLTIPWSSYSHSSKYSKSSSRQSSATTCSLQTIESPTTTDLKLTVTQCSNLIPWNETKRRTMFLSDWEQCLNFDIGTISFFPPNPRFSPEMVVYKLETAYRKALVHYDFLAGRLKFNTEQGRLEIDCNSAGAGFVVVSSELTLADLGDLAYSCPAFQQLDTMRPDNCLFVMQVVSFKCGGFAITTCMNHVAFDGRSLQMFLSNVASLLAIDKLLFIPCNDRRPLSSVYYLPQKPPEPVDMTMFLGKSQKLETKVLRLSPNEILKLKQEAMKDNASISKFKVIAAHIWRCKDLTRNTKNDGNKKSTLHVSVDLIPRLKHYQLPESYTGVAFYDATCTTTLQELEYSPFSKLVDMVSSTVSKITEEEIISIIKSGQWSAGNPFGDVILSPWTNLGLNDVEYPWGRPKCTCPLAVSGSKDVIIMFPDEKNKNGTNIALTLPHSQMHKFETMFYKLLE
ncbi:omega-hydroxypalmitate O-feruloyl transferase [Ranunculus cassubicifolius]